MGIAFLPGYRLTFNKHSVTRNCDAANIEKDSASMLWGFVYRMHDRDRQQLRKREKGYREISDLTVYLTSGDNKGRDPGIGVHVRGRPGLHERLWTQYRLPL